MSTLFQLHQSHSDLQNLNSLSQLYQQGDAIILMGQTLGFADALFSTNSLNKLGFDEQVFNPKLYALQDDFFSLNATAQDKLKQSPVFESIELIDDVQWVGLTENFDKVVTISH